jgi:hypothetical protein
MKTLKITLDLDWGGCRIKRWYINVPDELEFPKKEIGAGKTILRMVDKSYLDRTLPPTKTNEEYQTLVAEFLLKSMLKETINDTSQFNFEVYHDGKIVYSI